MKVDKEVEKKLEFDPEKVSDLHDKILEMLQDARPTVGELIILYGNLGYALGASIDGYTEKGPSPEELEKLYYSNPTIGVAMMLQGMTVSSWYEDWEKIKLQSQDKKENI